MGLVAARGGLSRRYTSPQLRSSLRRSPARNDYSQIKILGLMVLPPGFLRSGLPIPTRRGKVV
jgi:hypothetical protein